MKKALFITIEGGEGSGKSSLIKGISSWLTDNAQTPHLVTREPGGTPFGERLREAVLDTKSGKISLQAELLVFLAARLEHVEKVIVPHLDQGCFVICDRFIDSTVAYQAYGRKMCPDAVWALSLNTVPILPSITFYLDVGVDIGLRRIAHRRQGIDRLERESLSFHERVREGFLAQAQKYPGRIVTLDASQKKEQVLQEAIGILSKKVGIYAS